MQPTALAAHLRLEAAGGFEKKGLSQPFFYVSAAPSTF
jgi:hypothetical protein